MVSKTSSWVPQAAVNQQFLCKTTKAHTTKKKVQKPEQGNEKRAITQAGKKTKKKKDEEKPKRTPQVPKTSQYDRSFAWLSLIENETAESQRMERT